VDRQETLVPDYRIYYIGQNGRINAAETIDCETDMEALAKAAEILNGHPAIEVWQRARIVGKLTTEGGRTEVLR
jgi:hypothetical protein